MAWNLFRREKKSAPPVGLTDEAAWMVFGGGGPTAAGVTIGPESAMRVAAVRNAVALISESCGQISWRMHRKDGKARALETEHPLARWFRDGPNPWTTAVEFFSEMTADALQHGAGRALVTRGADGAVLEAFRLPPGSCSRRQDSPTSQPRYMVTLAKGGTLDVGRDEILEIRALDGKSPILQGREAIGLLASLERHAGRILGAGARPAGVLERSAPTSNAPTPQTSPEQLREREERFNAAWGGPEAAGRTIMLPVGSKFVPLTFSSVDMEFSSMRKFQIAEVGRIFRIPPVLLQELDGATYNNSEILGSQFVTFCLLFWVNSWEAALRLTCLSPEERDLFVIEGDLNDFLRADTKARFEAYGSAVLNGIMSRNEVRARENLPAAPGGDAILTPMNATRSTTGGGSAS